MADGSLPPHLVWLPSVLVALLLYGFGQGLVKMYIAEVEPARYCLYFFCAKTALFVGFWAWSGRPSPIFEGGLQAFLMGTSAYVLEGIGWICYYESVAAGPITIVGTLSAAYGAPTVVFCNLFLGEKLARYQAMGVSLVIAGCMALAYDPSSGQDAKATNRRWIPLAGTALVFWGLWQTLVKYTYNTFKVGDVSRVTDAHMALYNICGAFLTLGLYGLAFGRRGKTSPGEWTRSIVPMLMMAGGDLGVIIATAVGPASIVTPLSSAYPLVTLAFAITVLKERLTALHVVAIGAVLAGMLATTLA
jgi:drug/metabolite transporter (DMT)-like permease